jgi:sortase A
MSLVVLEGTDSATLDKSIAHVEETAMPGEYGNIGIAGHRNTHFKKMEWIRRGDELILKNAEDQYRYLVESIGLVTPDKVDVLDASLGPAITIVTCFPFEYVGNAPQRFIVRAVPDEETRRRLAHVTSSD